MIFADGSMVDNCSSGSSTQRIQMAKLLQSRTIFNCQWFNKIKIGIIIFKRIIEQNHLEVGN